MAAKTIRYYHLDVGGIFRPYIPFRVSLNHGNPSPHIDGLLDSGSDRNLFPLDLARMLGIDLKKCKPVTITGIGGIQIPSYTAQINIWINNEKYPTEADFSQNQQIPLLGRHGFFNLFPSIEFNENGRYVEIVL